MSEQPETPQGPVDPHGDGGIDAPAPPGGPQRTDSPGGSERPAASEAEPGQAGHIEEPVKHAEPAPAEDERQEENAETSLDQPSS
jgi:hypothetical protein